jgi:hypothetical protein
MSTDADRQRITLTETREGEWLATLEPAGVTGSGRTAQEALVSAREHARNQTTEALQALHNENTEGVRDALDSSIEATNDLLKARDDLEAEFEGEDGSYRSTTPLYDLIGMLDETESTHLRKRSREFRTQFSHRVEGTRRGLSELRSEE